MTFVTGDQLSHRRLPDPLEHHLCSTHHAGVSLAVSTSAFAADKMQIAFTVHSGASNTFWQAVQKGYEDACAKINADLLGTTGAGGVNLSRTAS